MNLSFKLPLVSDKMYQWRVNFLKPTQNNQRRGTENRYGYRYLYSEKDIERKIDRHNNGTLFQPI